MHKERVEAYTNNDIIIHNTNIPNNDKTNFFKYLTVDINSSIIIQYI